MTQQAFHQTGSVQVCLILIAVTGADYNTLLTIASEMILVPYLGQCCAETHPAARRGTGLPPP
jgi:hypothetical protein